jgi:hypothetical protein
MEPGTRLALTRKLSFVAAEVTRRKLMNRNPVRLLTSAATNWQSMRRENIESEPTRPVLMAWVPLKNFCHLLKKKLLWKVE